MNSIEWLRDAAEAAGCCRHKISLELDPGGVKVIAAAPGGYHRDGFLMTWDFLELCNGNPFIDAVFSVDDRVSRKIAGRPTFDDEAPAELELV